MAEVERKNNPVMSYSAEWTGDVGGMAVRFHDPETYEVVAEFYYDNNERLEGTAHGMKTSSAVMATIRAKGYEAAIADYGLEEAMVGCDLTDVDLRVEDILRAEDGPSDIVDRSAE